MRTLLGTVAATAALAHAARQPRHADAAEPRRREPSSSPRINGAGQHGLAPLARSTASSSPSPGAGPTRWPPQARSPTTRTSATRSRAPLDDARRERRPRLQRRLDHAGLRGQLRRTTRNIVDPGYNYIGVGVDAGAATAHVHHATSSWTSTAPAPAPPPPAAPGARRRARSGARAPARRRRRPRAGTGAAAVPAAPRSAAPAAARAPPRAGRARARASRRPRRRRALTRRRTGGHDWRAAIGRRLTESDRRSDRRPDAGRSATGVALDGLDARRRAPARCSRCSGPNGAGKTTTVRLLNGVLRPDAGRASVLGLDPAVDGDAVRRRTGVLTENAGLDDRLTAAENLERDGRIRGMGRAEADQRRGGAARALRHGRPGRRRSCRASRPASASASPSPAPCCTTPRCCSSTSRRRGSIPPPPAT